MKKQLIGTTALIGVGTLAVAGVTHDAEAADPLSLSIGGYYQTSAEYRDEDDDTDEPGEDKQQFGFFNDGEIQFTASTTLDNGIGVKARIEYEAKNQGGGSTIVDERYIQFSGGFGQLQIGQDDNASNTMHYQAPVVAGQMGVNTPTFAIGLAGDNAIGSYPTTYVNTTGDADKIIWFSPRIAGFQLGLSYAPDGSANQSSGQPAGDNDPGGQEDIISVGLNFVESFNDIDVAVSAGFLRGELEADGTTVTVDTATVVTGGGATANILTFTSANTGGDDIEEFSAGLNVGFAGFTVGASVRVSNGANNDSDITTWDAGVTYSTGPLSIGFTALAAEAETGGGDDETTHGVISANYNIGPGVDLWGGVKYFDYESDGGGAGAENEGYIIALGSSVSF